MPMLARMATSWSWTRNGVRNSIAIKPEVSAIDLKKAVTAALLRNAQLEGRSITVTVDKSTITLSGNVHTCAERHQADATAWSAPGVAGVVNDIVVSHE
jgi:osmotically-inducible protein OsmY